MTEQAIPESLLVFGFGGDPAVQSFRKLHQARPCGPELRVIDGGVITSKKGVCKG